MIYLIPANVDNLIVLVAGDIVVCPKIGSSAWASHFEWHALQERIDLAGDCSLMGVYILMRFRVVYNEALIMKAA
jgi:hypothetical protein